MQHYSPESVSAIDGKEPTNPSMKIASLFVEVCRKGVFIDTLLF